MARLRRKPGDHAENAAPADRVSLFARVKGIWLLIALIGGYVIAGLTFPKKIEEAYEVSVKTLNRVPRPVIALWYSFVGNKDSKSLELVRQLHPGAEFCLEKSEITDLVHDGWAADLIVVYAPKPAEANIECGTPDAPRDSLAVYTPVNFSFYYAGSAGMRDDPPSEWFARDGFIFRKWYQTDFPELEVWYLSEHKLIKADANIKLTDDSEHEYELRTTRYRNGLIGWGVPEGLFHMAVLPDGKFEKAAGLPNDLKRPDSQAVELRWSGTSFVDEAGKDWAQDFSKNPVIAVSQLAHLYLSGCEPIEGFTDSPLLPGAVVPRFDQSPLLQCGGHAEEEFTLIKLERAD